MYLRDFVYIVLRHYYMRKGEINFVLYRVVQVIPMLEKITVRSTPAQKKDQNQIVIK